MKSIAPRQKLGEALVARGVVSAEQLAAALEVQRTTGVMLGEALVNDGAVAEAVLIDVLADIMGIPGVVLRHGVLDPSMLKLIGAEEADNLVAIPMFRVRDTLTVAMAEPQSLPKLDRLRQLTKLRIRPVLALAKNIREFITKYRGGDVNVDAFLTSLESTDVEVVERESVDDGPMTNLDKMVAGSPIVNLINVLLLSAIRDKASDIHVEPEKKGTRVRYRIDGVLRDVMHPPPGMHSAIVSRLKVLSKMDIAEKRLPQEGRIRIVAEGRDIDLRVSSMPTLLGEKLVIRVLDKQNLKVRMEDLGIRNDSLATVKRMLDRPHGLFLVTGPTGSGKTTTLYSALDLLRSPELNLVTVEDPVEYQLELVNQIQVHATVGMTFARALRSVLRQDPDVIMIGEIRDEETARVAVQAALTGHLVLATLHTNDAAGAVSRLLDMGIESYLLSSAMIGVIAQRLARTVCAACATKYFPSDTELHDAGLQHHAGRPFRRGTGCKQCHDTGFKGRIGIYEVMDVNPEIRRLIHLGSPSHEIREQLRKSGGWTLREEGIALSLAGTSSLDEILRVTHDDDASTTEKHARTSSTTVLPAKEAA